ncbi:transposase [Variovorax sp. H27-G14]|uniref:transposase n=1 Tax=Variovorax sp. H27-G14 TaxID=3111914 RepID=UPI0038FCD1CB
MNSEQALKASRRNHDRAFKQEPVRQSLKPEASLSAIALRTGVNANMLFKWRRESKGCHCAATAAERELRFGQHQWNGISLRFPQTDFSRDKRRKTSQK